MVSSEDLAISLWRLDQVSVHSLIVGSVTGDMHFLPTTTSLLKLLVQSTLNDELYLFESFCFYFSLKS